MITALGALFRINRHYHTLASKFELTRMVSENVSIPVIASGGAGSREHFYEALTAGGAQAALAASLFHYKELEICEVKRYLREQGVSVRL